MTLDRASEVDTAFWTPWFHVLDDGTATIRDGVDLRVTGQSVEVMAGGELKQHLPDVPGMVLEAIQTK